MTQKKYIAGFLAVIIIVTVIYFLIDQLSFSYSHPADFAQDSVQREEAEINKPVVLYGMVVNDLHVVVDVVKRNQRFTDLLEGYYVSPHVQQQLSLLPRQTFDFRKISANRKYTLIAEHDAGKSVLALIYESSPIDYHIFHLKGLNQ